MRKVFYKRNFGCEFEFSTEFDDFKKIASKAITEVYGKNRLRAQRTWYKSSNNFIQWHLKIDNTTLSELCTPVSNYSMLKKIRSVLTKIGKNKNVKITKNDSFHVHMDVRDISKENILILWLKYEKLICALFPSHRRNRNSYCERSVNHHLKTSRQVSEYFKDALEKTLDHHSAISFYFYKKNNKNKRRKCRNTVEFRLGEGTTDSSFIRNWVVLLLHFLECCKKMKSPIESICDTTVECNENGIETLITELNIRDEKLKLWIYDRYEAFRNKLNK